MEKELRAKAEDAKLRAKQDSEMPDQRIINPKKLKDMFDKMTEIDTNPRSRSAQEF